MIDPKSTKRTEDRAPEPECICIITDLAELKPETLITEAGIARMFERCTRSVKRAVEKGELPAPCKMFGMNIWTVEVLNRHIAKRLTEAAEAAENEAHMIADPDL